MLESATVTLAAEDAGAYLRLSRLPKAVSHLEVADNAVVTLRETHSEIRTERRRLLDASSRPSCSILTMEASVLDASRPAMLSGL